MIILQQGILSQAAGGGGGSPLRIGLLEWWENANSVGRHSGGVVSTETTKVAGPNGLDAWRCQTDGLYLYSPIAVQADSAYSQGAVAWVGRINYNLNRSGCIAELGGGASGRIGVTWTDFGNIPQVVNGYSTANYFGNRFTFGAWSSIVVSFSGHYSHVYINGVYVGPIYDPYIPGPLYLGQIMGYGNGPGDKDDAIFAASSRAWDQTDVDLFHNAGSYLKYDDL